MRQTKHKRKVQGHVNDTMKIVYTTNMEKNVLRQRSAM